MADVLNIYDSALTVFPSSNTTGEGKTTSEPNLTGIITRMHLDNYIVNEGTGLTLSSGTLNIPDDYAVNIAGYLLTFVSTSVSSVPSDCDVFIELRFNSVDGLLYGKDTTPGSNYTAGALVTFATPSAGVQYVQIAKVVSGNLDSTFVPNMFPISSDTVQNGNTNTSLTNYIDTVAANTYLSKVANDTKDGNVVFGDSADPDDLYTMTIDNKMVLVKDDNAELIKISGNTIDGKASSLNVKATDQVIITGGNAGIVLTANGKTIQIDSNGHIIIDGIVLTFSSNTVDIACPTNVNLTLNGTGGKIDITGDVRVHGDITGDTVHGAVYN